MCISQWVLPVFCKIVVMPLLKTVMFLIQTQIFRDEIFNRYYFYHIDIFPAVEMQRKRRNSCTQ
jgi:hypothetical protein